MHKKINLWDFLDLIGIIITVAFTLQIFLGILQQFDQFWRLVIGIYILYLFLRYKNRFNELLRTVSLITSVFLIVTNYFELVKTLEPVFQITILFIIFWMYNEGKIPEETIHRLGTLINLRK